MALRDDRWASPTYPENTDSEYPHGLPGAKNGPRFPKVPRYSEAPTNPPLLLKYGDSASTGFPFPQTPRPFPKTNRYPRALPQRNSIWSSLESTRWLHKPDAYIAQQAHPQSPKRRQTESPSAYCLKCREKDHPKD